MRRQPEQVHIYLYRKNRENLHEFAIFQRSDNNLWWQGITGGVEKGETIEEASRREIFEEAGIKSKSPLYKLETKSYLPVYLFDKKIQEIWGPNVIVIPMYFYAMFYDGPIKLSWEHDDVIWATYEKAEELVYFHDQKVALWELKERLIRRNLIEKIL